MEAPLPRFLTPGVHLLTSSEMSRLPKGESDLLRDAIDIMGKRSAKAQGLSKAITVFNALIGSASGNRLYLSIGAPAEKGGERTVRGLLRVGERQLFVLTNPNDVKSYKQVNPTCVLDFYVHESCQRKGDGRKLFDAMLHDENKKPEKLAYDRPSSKLLGFCAKHFGLSSFIPQNNNFVLFDQFWTKPGAAAASSTSAGGPRGAKAGRRSLQMLHGGGENAAPPQREQRAAATADGGLRVDLRMLKNGPGPGGGGNNNSNAQPPQPPSSAAPQPSRSMRNLRDRLRQEVADSRESHAPSAVAAGTEVADIADPAPPPQKPQPQQPRHHLIDAAPPFNPLMNIGRGVPNASNIGGPLGGSAAPSLPPQPQPQAAAAPSSAATMDVASAQSRLLEAQGRTRKYLAAHEAASAAAQQQHVQSMPPSLLQSNGRPPLERLQNNNQMMMANTAGLLPGQQPSYGQAPSYITQVDAAREKYLKNAATRMTRRPF